MILSDLESVFCQQTPNLRKTMDHDFISKLRSIDTSNPRSSAESIYHVFSTISRLNEEDVIAAHQTFNFYFKDRKKQDKITEQRIEMIKKALETRMQHLCSLAPFERRRGLAITFTEAIGDPLMMILFKQILQR